MKVKMPFPSGHTMSLRTLRRSFFGFGSDHNQIHSKEMLDDFDVHLDRQLELFQYQVFFQFKTLSESSADEFLSLNWLSKLLDAFVVCLEDFRAILLKNEAYFSEPPLDKLLKDFFNRSIKALDICNAVCDGIEKIQCWHKHLEIISNALSTKQKKLMSRGRFRRARKASTDLTNVMLEDGKDCVWSISRRLKSFGHLSKARILSRYGHGPLRSLSWNVASYWSAGKQLQYMSNSLIPPLANESIITDRLANVVFTMGFVYMFVFWALVNAIPCQGRGHHANFSIPKHFSWATPFSVLHVRIMNEFKKRDSQNSLGLLKEIYQMEQSVRFITNLIDSTHQFPLTEEQKETVRLGYYKVSLVSSAYKNGLHPLEYQVRQVFRKIMSFQTEGLEILCRA